MRNPALLQCFGAREVYDACTPWCLIVIRAETEILHIVDTGKLMWRRRGVPGGVCKLNVQIPWLSWGVGVENTTPFDKCFLRKPTKKALEGLNHFYKFLINLLLFFKEPFHLVKHKVLTRQNCWVSDWSKVKKSEQVPAKALWGHVKLLAKPLSCSQTDV